MAGERSAGRSSSAQRALVAPPSGWNNAAAMSAPQIARPDMTALLARGVTRMLIDHGLASVLEVPLANGRRADIMAITDKGEIWIVETKSCLADYAVDQKWPDYLDYCDRYFFAVADAFPHQLIPEQAGLIIADGFGGAIVRESPLRPLAPARRKAVTLSFARLAAWRLASS